MPLKQKLIKLICYVTVATTFIYHGHVESFYSQHYFDDAHTINANAQGLNENIAPIIITAALCAGALYLGWRLYRYIHPTDEYYIDRAENILSDLQKNEEKLLQLSNFTDANSIVDTLIALAEENQDSSSTLDLMDQHWKKVDSEIIKVTAELS